MNLEKASPGLIPLHGGYRKLKSFQVAQLAYDVTVRFCDRYIDRRSRTHDQMVQAARSGVQNIAEGSQASGTSKKTELKLTNVARASLEELRLDYQDFFAAARFGAVAAGASGADALQGEAVRHAGRGAGLGGKGTPRTNSDGHERAGTRKNRKEVHGRQ